MSVRPVGPTWRPLAPGLATALLLAVGLGSFAVASGAGLETATADPSSSTTSSPSTTTPPTTTPLPTTTAPPRTTTTSPPATTVPGTSTVPTTTSVPPTTTTVAPQGQTGPTLPAVLAVVVSTGDGLTVRSTDGTESPAQVGESLQRGDQLSTTGPSASPSTPHQASIQWMQGGTTDIYDATPRIFVHGHDPVPAVATTISIDADPTPTMSVMQGFARFSLPPSEKGWYNFVASTESVVVTDKGTDFTVGHNPATRTSTVGVTQDAVEVAPVNPSLHAFRLSSGSEVSITPDRVGPITPLADQSANNARHRPQQASTTTLALWLVGLLLGVAVVSGTVGLASLWRDRRRRHRPTIPVLPPRPARAPDLTFAHAGGPGSTGWVTLPPRAFDEVTEQIPGAPAEGRRAPDPDWKPTHRVPLEGMKARAIPVADAGDVATLDPNLAVRVVERRGDWANVLSADGWSGWVDARQLQPDGDPA